MPVPTRVRSGVFSNFKHPSDIKYKVWAQVALDSGTTRPHESCVMDLPVPLGLASGVTGRWRCGQ